MADSVIRQITIEDGGTFGLEDEDARYRIDNAEEEIAQARTGTDGTTYTTLDGRLDAEFSKQSGEIGELQDFTKRNCLPGRTKYLAIPDVSWDNKWVDKEKGELHDDDGTRYHTTDFIPCFSGQTLEYYSIAVYKSIAPIVFYDEGKNFKSAVTDYEQVGDVGNHVKGTATVPDGACYFKYCSGRIFIENIPSSHVAQTEDWHLVMWDGVESICDDIDRCREYASGAYKYDEPGSYVDTSSEVNITEGKYLDSGGQIIDYTGQYAAVTDLVDIYKANGLLVTSKSLYDAKQMLVTDINHIILAVFSSSGTEWTRHEIVTSEIIAEYPRARYLIFGSIETELKFERRETTTVHDKIEELDNKKLSITYTVPSSHEKMSMSFDTGYLDNKGNVGSTDQYKHTGFLSLDDYPWLIANTSYGLAAVPYVLYNSSKKVVAAPESASTGVNKQFELVASSIIEEYPTAKYIRFSGLSSGNYQLRVFSRTTSSDVYDGLQYSMEHSNVLYGKKVAFCGDSFTEASNLGSDYYDPFCLCYKSYGWRIANRNRMPLYHDGISGSTMHVVDTETPDTRKPFAYQRYKNVPSDCDYIIMQFGLNESSIADSESTLGTKDSTDTTTMWGSWNTVMEYLITNHPTARIGVIMSDAWMPQSYYTALSEICEWWGVPMLDLGGDKNIPLMNGGRRSGCGLTLNPAVATLRNKTFYNDYETGDSHPNDAGHEWRSTVIENWMRSL